jgi:LAO/AO transport system kinase
MTLIESELPEDRIRAITLLEACEERLYRHDPSIRITVSGSPGVGKSSLIEAAGRNAIDRGHRVGVVTIDPTSSLSKGSILGDKSRMTHLANSPHAFVRSSPAGKVLGGLGRRTFELVTLLAAVGYDLIFIETVGVGQSEHMAWQLTDAFTLVIQPGAGDELQGIKRGITELADMVIVNKADGDFIERARLTKTQYQSALHYFTPLRKGWSPVAMLCSATAGSGLDAWLDAIEAFRKNLLLHDELRILRKGQQEAWLEWNLGMEANRLLLQHPAVKNKLQEFHQQTQTQNISIFKMAYGFEQLMQSLLLPSSGTAES